MKSYEREFAILRRLGELDAALQAGAAVLRPLSAAAELSESPWARLTRGAYRLTECYRSTFWISQHLTGSSRSGGRSSFVHSLWLAAETVATVTWADTPYVWRDVYGVPVAFDTMRDSKNFESPATEREILERLRGSNTSWIIRLNERREPELVPETEPPPAVMSELVQRIVDRTQRFDSCRAWLLWGPPGGGKTRAARQVAAALTKSCVTLTGACAADSTAWNVVETLRPEGIIIDDIDSVKESDELLEYLDRAHSYAKVIVSTANVTTSLRGALVRPGRAADEEPVHVAVLDQASREAIAPHVPESMRGEDLLAAYLAELDARARAGVLQDSDAETMRKRMTQAGER